MDYTSLCDEAEKLCQMYNIFVSNIVTDNDEFEWDNKVLDC